MFIFGSNGRIQKTTEGIHFYEQDVLSVDYLFGGDIEIQVNINYLVPGFGFVVMEKSEVKGSNNSLLFKLGSNDFRVIKKHFDTQTEIVSDSCLLKPSVDNNSELIFRYRDGYAEIGLKQDDAYVSLGSTDIADYFEEYQIGFYSNAGNTIKNASIYKPIPKHWRTSVKNTYGGRITFFQDEAIIENCDYDAEIEQQSISLAAGTYFLKYETEEVNNTMDIKSYVFPTVRQSDEEAEFEDDYKNILKSDNSFTLESDCNVNLKFKGKNGIIKDICVTDNKHSSFMETEDEPAGQDGSEITVKTTGMSRIEWTATVFDVPEWTDLTVECPYALIQTSSSIYTKESFDIELGKKYRYVYDVQRNSLDIYDVENDELTSSHNLYLGGQNYFKILKNVTATLYELLLIDEEEGVTNLLLQKTMKKLIPASINSPIIVTKDEEGEAFDLSVSYREVVTPKTEILLFSSEYPVQIKDNIPQNALTVKLYGIPKSATINRTANSIEEVASVYEEIGSECYTRKSSYFDIETDTRKLYKYIAVEYTNIDDYVYEFTNYEREIYDITSGGENYMKMSKTPTNKTEDIVIYGIPTDANVFDDYLYRVPSDNMINSIDYYTDKYEIIPADKFNIDFNVNEVSISDSIIDRYKTVIIDYLKNDSYCINYREEEEQYEIDVATDYNKVFVHYDMHEDGNISKYLHTEIQPKSSKYIILKQK